MFTSGLSVYVVHYTPFIERRKHVEQVLEANGLNQFPVKWILEFDRETLLEDYRAGKLGDPTKVSASMVSVVMKHLKAYEMIRDRPDGWHLVLEDDILVKPDLLKRLDRLKEKLPEDWEIFFIGLGCDLHVPWWRRRAGKEVYFRGWKAWWRAGAGCSRCMEAYLINPKFAAKLLDSRFGKPPFDCPIDWHLNKAGWEMKVQSYWAEPPLITQGAFESWTKDPKLAAVLTSDTNKGG